ncbi:MAG: hypothetical protein IT285_06535 [Bdellovibrionales bacterium]|nr:hypothetical protein [Bdellovibrionales bacterium]
MKGAFFQKTLEFRLTVDGETWHQGEAVKGALSVKNHGPEPVPAAELRVLLAQGVDRKVKAKAEGAFQVLATLSPGATAGSLGAGATSTPLGWDLTLDANAPVTDRSGSLYLLYGKGEELANLGHLQLTVKPRVIFQDLIDVLTVTYHFAVKHVLARKGGIVEVKFSPPDGRSFSFVEHLLLALRMDGDTIDAGFEFHVKQVDATQPGLNFKKGTQSFELKLESGDYVHSFNGRLKKEAAEAAVKGILDEVQKTRGAL